MKHTSDYTLTRGVADILPTKKGLADLMTAGKITLYQGFDATAPSLHIGHMIGIRKLAQFQQLGHKVIFLIGDFTSLIGDPTDKSAARVKQTPEQVQANFANYQKQIANLIDFDGDNKAEVLYNSEWLSKLKFADIVDLASNFTVQQMIERSMFQDRLKNNKPIYLHEFFYPLMQGYDSLHMGVDLEIGGSDQLFNMLAGRTLMESVQHKHKYVLTLKLLEDPSGKKMGKTEGNAVNLDSDPADIYGGIMALPDGFIERGIELMTDLPLDLAKEVGPLQAKKDWAHEVVKQIYDETAAKEAQKSFEQTFQKGAPSFDTAVGGDHLLEVVEEAAGVSTSQAKRLVKDGAVSVNGEVAEDTKQAVEKGDQVRVGKKIFVTVA